MNKKNMLHLGLLGKTLSHSVSPQIHAYLLKQQNICGTYSKFEMDENQVPHILDTMKRDNIWGLNVTIPYKELLCEMMDILDPHAENIGAVNTIFLKDGKFHGYNTDFVGALNMFHKAGVTLKNKSMVILGSGGAAKALIYGVHLDGAAKITVAGRNIQALLHLQKIFPFICTCSMTEIPKGDILVNTTPLGMYPKTEETPVGSSLIRQFKIAADIVYNPLITKFLKIAAQEGLQTVTGLTMLIDQAIGSQEIWLDKALDYEIGREIHHELAEKFFKGV